MFIEQLSNNQPQSSAPRCLSLQTSKTFHSLATAPSLLTRYNLPHTLKGCNHSHRCGKQSIAAILPLVWVYVCLSHAHQKLTANNSNQRKTMWLCSHNPSEEAERFHRKSPSGRAFQKGLCAVDRKYKTFEELLRAARNVIKHLPPLRPDWFLLAINHTSEERDRNHKRGETHFKCEKGYWFLSTAVVSVSLLDLGSSNRT